MSSVLGSADLAARAAALAERARSERPPAWIPDDVEKGHPSTIVGVLVAYEQASSAFGPRTIAIVRELEGREWSVWLHSTVLQQEFAEQSPQAGELIAVHHLGRKKAKNPQPGTKGEYESYRLVVDRDVAPAPANAPADDVCRDCGVAGGQHSSDCIPF